MPLLAATLVECSLGAGNEIGAVVKSGHAIGNRRLPEQVICPVEGAVQEPELAQPVKHNDEKTGDQAGAGKQHTVIDGPFEWSKRLPAKDTVDFSRVEGGQQLLENVAEQRIIHRGGCNNLNILGNPSRNLDVIGAHACDLEGQYVERPDDRIERSFQYGLKALGPRWQGG